MADAANSTLTATASASRTGPGARLLAAVALSAALAPLNSTMIAVALPDLRRSFAVDSGSLLKWLVTSYLLTSIVLQSVGGKASDRLGHRRALGIGQLLFAVGAALAYLAPRLWLVSAARVTMAAAGAIIVPSALALLRSELPIAIRGRAFGAFGSAMALSAAVGPKLGAPLIAHFGWRSMFLANIPVLLIATLLAHTAPRPRVQDADGRPSSRFDLVGALLLGGSLLSIALGCQDAHRRFLLPIGVLGLAPFAWWERRVRDPLVDFQLFSRPAFVGGSLIIALQNMAMYALLFELPQVSTRLFGARLREASSALTAMMAAMVVTAPLAGRISDRIGPRALTLVGSLSALAGTMLLWWRPLATLAAAIPPLVLVGVGLGLSSAPAQAASLSAVPKDKSGMAAGLTSTLRYMGAVAGVAVLGIVLTDAPDAAVVNREHRTALSCFCGALLISALCSFALPGRRAAPAEGLD